VVKLYVEGGGDSNALRAACREGFTSFITKAGVAKRPRVVACGSRRDAFDSFCTAIANGEEAMLLVDSEAPVSVAIQQPQDDAGKWTPWPHLKSRPGDGWDKPTGSEDSDCHLMVQCMESWFLADRATLKAFFDPGFDESELPAAANPTGLVTKSDVFEALKKSTRDCKTKGAYGKGQHSFKLLASIDPAKVAAACPWARRFIDCLKAKMQGDEPNHRRPRV
jgi:hypothetical protein